nr:hypothetical protein [uncultured archaeon]
MRKCIFYTRFDGGVSIYYPADECLLTMKNGGWWDQYPKRVSLAQVSRQVERGIPHWAAQRFFDALGDGGLDEHEALTVLRDRDCSYLGTAHEIVGVAGIPRDRWFRDAWRRSHNGGPIYIDMPAARRIQFARLRHHASSAGADLQLGRWKERIKRAETPETLRTLWPSDRRLPSHAPPVA